MRPGQRSRRLAVALASLVAFVLTASTASALHETDGPDVAPTQPNPLPGNIIGGPPPDSQTQAQCLDHGYDWGLSTGGNVSGTYVGTIPPATQGGQGTSVTIEVDFNADRTVDFESTVPVQAAAIKGGPQYTLYDYGATVTPGPQTDDDGLITPQGQSHAVFCFNNQDGSNGTGMVTVSKTATATWSRSYNWELTKKVNWELWKLFTGDSGTSEYTVTAEATPSDAVTVTGKINITNTFDEAVTVTALVDTIDQNGVLTNATITGCGVPFDVAADGAVSCDYSATLPSSADGVNRAVATISANGQSAQYPTDFPVDVPDAPTTDSSASASLTDDSPAWPGDLNILANETPKVVTYSRTFACGADAGMHTNTATLTPKVGDPIVRQAKVTVRCFDLDVKKTAKASFKRVWVWNIDKYASHEQIVLARKKDPNSKKNDLALSRYARSATVHYAVKVYAESRDRNLKVEGYINVKNPAGSMRTAHVKSVADTLLDPSVAAVVSDCRIVGGGQPGGPSYGYDIPAGETLRCDYVAMPDSKSKKNKATAMNQNYAYTAVSNDGVHIEKTALGTTPYMDEIDIDWDVEPRAEVDKTARVYDSKMGFLGWATAPGPKRFEYSLHIAPGDHGAPLCGKGAVYNQASVVGNDSGDRAEDSVRIPVTVLCFEHKGSDAKKDGGDAGGATNPKLDPKLDPAGDGVSLNDKGQIDGVKAGDGGPAPIVCTPSKRYEGKRGAKGDPAWRMIGRKGMKTRFFKAGEKVSYGKVMRGGKSPYRRLARVYVMAKLYALSGAPVDARTSKAMVWTDRYLSKNGPKAKKQRKLMAKNAKVLKRYSKRAKGYQGPGCNATT